MYQQVDRLTLVKVGWGQSEASSHGFKLFSSFTTRPPDFLEISRNIPFLGACCAFWTRSYNQTPANAFGRDALIANRPSRLGLRPTA